MIASQREMAPFTILDVRENIDTSSVAEFLKAIQDLIANGNVHLVVNFSGIDFLCSKAINVLVRAWKDVAAVNGSLQVIAGDPEINRLFGELSIHKLMPVHSNEEQFLKQIKRGVPKPPSFQERITGTWVILDLYRPITIVDGYKELDAKLTALLGQGRKRVALNFSATRNLYSETAGLIVLWQRQLSEAGGNLSLLGDRELAEPLERLGLDRFVHRYDSETDLPDSGQQPR